jgi:hypothetical protein
MTNPAPIHPMLDDLELSLVQVLRTEEDQVWLEHSVAGLQGSLLQRLSREPTSIHLQGVMAGEGVLEKLEKLRQLYQDAQPVPFTADIMTATEVTQVLIDNLAVRELAGKPERFEYSLGLVEFVPTPDPVQPPIEPPVDPICVDQKGSISVTVVLPEGQTDFTGVVVRIQRTDVEGAAPIEITEHTNGVFTRTGLDPGEYRATAFKR